MLEFKPLTLDDKELFSSYLNPYTFSTCEYSYINLFIWRKGCDIQYTIYKDALIIKKRDFDFKYHFMQPLGYSKVNLKEIVDELITYKKLYNMDFLFKDCEDAFIDDLNEIYPGNLFVKEDRDNFDYIYDSEKLMSLSGNKLHGKKNHYNYFIKTTNYRTAPLNEAVAKDCIQSAREWCSRNGCKGYLLYELNAIEDLLNNMDKLNFIGMVVYVDDKLSAFTIGEKVNSEMAIVHIEKADPDIRGLYTFINKYFVENYLNDVPLINREQDLGLEGLRKAKESYHPLRLEPKYLVQSCCS